MTATVTRRSNKITATLLIVVGYAVITYLSHKYERYQVLQAAAGRHYSSLESLLGDVEELGGELIVCRHGVCQNAGARETVASGRDGYYLVYPQGADVTEEVIQHQGEEIKRLGAEIRL